MMFENAVRPFQLFQALRLSRLVPAPATSAPPPGSAFIAWGAAGTMPTPQSTQYQLDHCKNEHDEIKRQSDTIRIENPDDPEQYIMVDRADQMIFDTSHHQDPLPDATSYGAMNSDGDIAVEDALNQLSADFSNANWVPGLAADFGDSECKLTVNLNNGATSA